MATLYKVYDEYESRYYWAGSRNHAKDMFIEQTGHTKAYKSEVEADMVWADNNDMRYRGYVTNDA